MNFRKKFRELGLKKGDVILLSSAIFSLGKLNYKNENDLYQDILDSIFDIIKKDYGTIIMQTYTTDVVRYGKSYNGKKEICTSGAFANYFMKKKETILSYHPAQGYGAIGRKSRHLMKNGSFSNWGYKSTIYNLLKHDCKILRIGLDPGFNTFAHVAESIVGVPYFYSKLVRIKNNVKNKKVSSTMFVRYKNLYPDLYDYEKLNKDVKKNCNVNSIKIGRGYLYFLDGKEYFNFITDRLTRDMHYLLTEKPKYKFGVIPYDKPLKKHYL